MVRRILGRNARSVQGGGRAGSRQGEVSDGRTDCFELDRPEQRSEDHPGESPAGHRLAGLHRADGNLVAACRVQDRQGQCRGRHYRAARRRPLVRRGEDGSTCDWGSVLAWEPNTRLVLSWDIDANFQYDPKLKTEIEVRFIA